ncbi:MAG: XRE family transcriptional regulator [Gammaproteobacteria bacterium]|nr:XRE family transcriptional regulator [Gammaproteobacteria bacterium]
MYLTIRKNIQFSGLQNTMSSTSAGHFGRRIRALREERGLSQEELARVFGFNDRQTVSAVETGARRLTAEELLLVMNGLNVPLDYFTDPFRLVGEGRFSWRQKDVDAPDLAAYEQQAGQWIAAFRSLAPEVGQETRFLRMTLGLTKRSSFEDAMHAGERFAAKFELGDVPAARLAEVMERRLGILVLMVDAPHGVSGAACQLPELEAALISRNEVVGRRSFDLAHELFHLLTWDAMPPEHSEEINGIGRNRVEQLANNFAGAVLMPPRVLEPFGKWSHLSQDDLVARLNSAADRLQVSSSALRWRLAALGELSQRVAKSLPEERLRYNGRGATEGDPPARFSRLFMEVIGGAIERGLVSVRRAARLLDLTVEDLADTFAAHQVPCSVEL